MTLKHTLLLAALPFAIISCKQSENTATETKTEKTVALAAKPEKASFKIDGMVCSVGCAKTIEKKLAAMEGVSKVVVDYDTKEAVVEFDANLQNPEKLVEAVESAADGNTYKVHDLTSSGDHAMVYNKDKEKEKEKRKKKKNKKKGEETEASATEKKEGCESGAADAKPGCCSKKKISVI